MNFATTAAPGLILDIQLPSGETIKLEITVTMRRKKLTPKDIAEGRTKGRPAGWEKTLVILTEVEGAKVLVRQRGSASKGEEIARGKIERLTTDRESEPADGGMKDGRVDCHPRPSPVPGYGSARLGPPVQRRKDKVG